MLPTLHSIGHDDAAAAIDAATARAWALGVPQNIAAVDKAGHLVAFRRMDGAKFIATDIATDKAFTAADARRATSAIAAVALPGHAGFGINTQQHGRFTILAGGLPLMSPDSGEVVGGIGVSSDSTAEDEDVAEAGAAAFKILIGRPR
jgi:uncharacterized protein GlcG (DUF336 family)